MKDCAISFQDSNCPPPIAETYYPPIAETGKEVVDKCNKLVELTEKAVELAEKIKKHVRIMKYVELLQANTGGEQGHSQADDALCNLLKELGYDEVVEAYENVPDKWYS